jgi:hypothetical protein
MHIHLHLGVTVSFLLSRSQEAMLDMLNDGGVVAVCGAISEYDTRPAQRRGVRNLFQAVAKRLRIEGQWWGKVVAWIFQEDMCVYIYTYIYNICICVYVWYVYICTRLVTDMSNRNG